MARPYLVYLEHDAGAVSRPALEVLSWSAGRAARAGSSVLAVALGAGAREVAAEAGRYGADQVWVSDNRVFDDYLVDPTVFALAHVAREHQPDCLLLPFTPDSKDVAARLSARFESAAVSNVVGFAEEEQRLLALETVFGGEYTTTVAQRNSVLPIYVVRANALELVENRRTPEIHELQIQVPDAAQRVRRGRRVREQDAAQPLEEAATIVAGGRGLGGPAPFELLRELASALEGALGASRAAVDAGWIAYEYQIGQTGRTVKPELYIAVGISGAVQHRVGMQTAQTIVAINRDTDAPITQLADLTVVGDLFEIVPALTEEVRRRKGTSS